MKYVAAAAALIALGIGVFVLSVWMVVWNVTDIYDNGLNFWNTFWLMLVGVGFFGTTAGAAANR